MEEEKALLYCYKCEEDHEFDPKIFPLFLRCHYFEELRKKNAPKDNRLYPIDDFEIPETKKRLAQNRLCRRYM